VGAEFDRAAANGKAISDPPEREPVIMTLHYYEELIKNDIGITL
jgi:hypothetical protein